MARLRYSMAEARAEATRRAEVFMVARQDYHQWRHRGTAPDPLVPPSRASKHPVAWVAVYAPISPDDGVIDGGELFVTVDLVSGAVAVRALGIRYPEGT